MNFTQKWHQAVQKKNSILCIGLDPAEQRQRNDDTIPRGTSKLDWCLNIIDQVAPFAAAVKPNRKYIKDLSREDVKKITGRIHQHDMLAIIDSKMTDIGETNDAALFHAQQEGFDAITFAPFGGNMKEAVMQAHARNLGLIALVLMSNPEFEQIKNATINGMKAYEFFATQVTECDADGMVIGAPSDKNHITKEEVKRVKAITRNKLVLMPGIGAQGGDAEEIIELFGDNVIANVGRAVIYAQNPAEEARKYKEMLRRLRK
ncbi:orotidine-5'-phosphate decarboxylase [Candidatus Woesearchaeota archaeon]|nr:orotidine-5'-phosphate decarboxylase [Candidatus Woesearchaeota archaeon]